MNKLLNISIRVHISMLIFIVSVLSSASFADVGNKAANFSLPNLLTKDPVSLSDYMGAVVLVDFWASWCGPCRASFPAYEKLRNRLQEKYGEESFEVLAINVDMEMNEALSFLKKRTVSFPILDENTGGDTQHKYQILAMPTAFLIDQSGVIVFQHSGFNSSYASHIERLASELIESKTVQH